MHLHLHTHHTHLAKPNNKPSYNVPPLELYTPPSLAGPTSDQQTTMTTNWWIMYLSCNLGRTTNKQIVPSTTGTNLDTCTLLQLVKNNPNSTNNRHTHNNHQKKQGPTPNHKASSTPSWKPNPTPTQLVEVHYSYATLLGATKTTGQSNLTMGKQSTIWNREGTIK